MDNGTTVLPSIPLAKTIGIATSLVEFSPSTAKEWLKHNTKNRNPARSAVDRYKRDMADGLWKFAADPIRVDTTGRILDGQHRLMALSELDDSVRITFLVVTGLEPETQMVMDQGVKRTTGQQLMLSGIKNANTVASSAKLYMVWSSGLLFRKSSEWNLSTVNVQEWVAEHPEFVEFENEVHGTVSDVDASATVVTAALWGFAQIDRDASAEFLRLLASGAGLSEDSPILVLDKRLRRIRRESVKISSRDLLALFIQAWGLWRTGKAVTKFQKPRGGVWTEETFPTL